MTDKEDEKLIDVVTEEEKEIAQNIYSEFLKKNYGTCLTLLSKLDHRTQDFKVTHNKAVVEYFKNDLKKSDNFQKSLNALCNQLHIKIEKVDDVDHCTLHYNQAVLLFHQKQYMEAQRIMDRVYKFIEPMEDILAKQVSLLAIELQLCMRQPDKALTFITYLENNLLSSPTKPSDKTQTSKPKKNQDLNLDELKRKVAKYKARCFLMKHQLSAASKELQLFSKEKSNVDVLLLQSNLEYLKGNFEESIKILTSIPNECLNYSECGESSTVMFYNNMGVVHFSMGKFNLAAYYFQSALKEDFDNIRKKEDFGEKVLFTLGGNKYHELMYNLGIALLHAKKPVQAFDCLVIAVRRYHRNSRLWMRLAECCIMVHKESNEVDFDMKRKQKDLVVKVIGSQEKQKLILTTNLSTDKKYSTESQSYAVPVPSLEFASLCLRNAFLLLPSDTASPVPLFLIPGVTPPAPPPTPGPAPSSPLSPDSVQALKNNILIDSAYVSLCLGDYIIALEQSKLLLEQNKISGVHKLLARLYAAEALVLMDNINEALEYLNPDKIKDISFDFSNEDTKETKVKTSPPTNWYPDNLAGALAVMQYNMAVVKAIRGQLDQAGALLKQIWKSPGCKVPPHIIMLVIYIELQMGRADVARNLIKQYSFQQRLSG